MGSLGIKLVGRARPLEHLALIRAILHARGIKLPQNLDVPVPDTKVCCFCMSYHAADEIEAVNACRIMLA